MPDAPSSAFSYAIVRVVPRVERGELLLDDPMPRIVP